MNLSINCRCGTKLIIPNKRAKTMTSFSCPVCNSSLSAEHLDKVKKCLSLIDDCHLVHAPKNSSSGIVDLGYAFTIDFVE